MSVLGTTATLVQDGNELVDTTSLTGSNWIVAGVVVVTSVVIAAITSRVVRSGTTRTVGDGLVGGLVARVVAYAIVALGVTYGLTTLGVRVGPLLGALGLGGLVLALALQKVVENFVAALIIQSRRPFTVGDTIDVDGVVGVVDDVDGRETILTGLDGTEHRIPNGIVVATDIHNLTRNPCRRSELVVGVAYDTDLEVAHGAILAALAKVPRVLDEPPPLVVLRRFASSSIEFTVYIWHHSDVPSELAAGHDAVVAIHREFAATGVVIAFPQVVVWTGQSDGSGPYADRLDRVHTDLPVAAPTNRRRSRRGGRLLRNRDAGGAP